MKKFVFGVFAIVFVVTLFVTITAVEDHNKKKTLLIGKWVSQGDNYPNPRHDEYLIIEKGGEFVGGLGSGSWSYFNGLVSLNFGSGRGKLTLKFNPEINSLVDIEADGPRFEKQ